MQLQWRPYFRIMFFCGTFASRIKISLELSLLIVRHSDVYFVLRQNYVIYSFKIVSFFHNVRITLYFGTFKMRSENALSNGYI